MQSLLGLIVPLPAEARALFGRRGWQRQNGWCCCRGRLPGGAEVLAVRSGQGGARARAAAAWLVERGATILAVMGVAGGLHPALRPGDLVLAGENRWESLPLRREANAWLQVQCGNLADVGQPVLTPAGKAALFRESGALAVDLESAAVGRLAREAGLPFFALRAVCDPAGREVPAELWACLTEAGRVRPAVLIRAVLNRPRLIRDLLRLRRDFAAALGALRREWPGVAERVVGQR